MPTDATRQNICNFPRQTLQAEGPSVRKSVHQAVTKSNNKNVYSALKNLPGNIELFQKGSKLDIIFFCNWTCLSVRIDNSTFERVEEFKYLGTTLTNQNSILFPDRNLLDCGQEILAIIRYGIFCLPGCYPKI